METLNNNNCEFQDKVIDYCEGTLAEEDAKRIEEHLEGCAECSAVCREHKAFCEALSACNAEVPAELHGNIMRAVRREALREKFMRAAKRYAAPVAAALVLAIGVPAMIRNGAENGVADAPAMYSVTEEAAMDMAVASDGKGRLGEPTYGLNAEVEPCAPADSYADVAEAPAAEANGDYEVYQYVVENGEVVTCYNCPVVKVDADVLKKLGEDYAELVVVAENGGILFKADKKLITALKNAGCDTAEIKRADFIRVNDK